MAVSGNYPSFQQVQNEFVAGSVAAADFTSSAQKASFFWGGNWFDELMKAFSNNQVLFLTISKSNAVCLI